MKKTIQWSFDHEYIDSKEDKKGREKRVQFPIGNLKLWHGNGTSPSKKETKTSVQWNTRWNLSTRIDSASFVFHSWKMVATSWWYTVTKSHQSSPGPKRFTENRQLICQFIRQRNSHWATRASEVADIYSSFSQTLPFSLSLFFYALLLVGRSRIPSWSCSTTPSSEISVRRRRGQPSGTSNEHFWVAWRERRARYRRGARSWTRFARSPRFYRRSKSLEIE